MLWLLHFRSVQILVALWVLQIIYTAIVTIRTKFDYRIKALFIVGVFLTSWYTIVVSENLLGTPNFSNNDIEGVLDGYDIFMHDGIKEFAVMISTKSGPMLITVPFSSKTKDKLSNAMATETSSGIPIIFKRIAHPIKAKTGKKGSGNGTDHKGNGNNGNQSGSTVSHDHQTDNGMVFEFTKQSLPPKRPDE